MRIAVIVWVLFALLASAFAETVSSSPSRSSVSDDDAQLKTLADLVDKGHLQEALALRKDLLDQAKISDWRLYYVVGRQLVLRHDYLGAIPELKKAAELGEGFINPDVIDASYRLLHCHVVKKQWKEAEKLGPKLIKLYPEVAYKFQMEMGKAYQVQEKFDEAIEYLETAAEKCPKDFDNAKRLYKTLLDCYDQTLKFDKAIELGKKLVADYPDEPGYKWELGRAYVYTKEYEKAAPLFEKVMETSKAEWEIRSSQIFYGQCVSNLGKAEEALERIEAYYKDKPELWDSYLLAKAAVLFYGPKDDEGCAKNLKELLSQVAAGKKSDLVRTARELLSKALGRSEKWEELAPLLEEMAGASRSPVLLSRAGDAYFRVGNYTEAKRVYKEVTDADKVPDGIRAECMYGLALCYWEAGLRDAARRLLYEVSGKYPGTREAKKALGMIVLWSGKDWNSSKQSGGE